MHAIDESQTLCLEFSCSDFHMTSIYDRSLRVKLSRALRQPQSDAGAPENMVPCSWQDSLMAALTGWGGRSGSASREPTRRGGSTIKEEPIFSKDTFCFFRDLSENNRTDWMRENRDRYETHIVKPFRNLLEALTPRIKYLNPQFDTSGRTGRNFSRINRDIRFAKDKSPYRAQMYLTVSESAPKGRDAGQLYVGVSVDAVTAGFRIYGDRKQSHLALVARPRAIAGREWLAAQARKLGRRYESYWHAREKREWVRREGWPLTPADWERLEGWIVRVKMKPADAIRPGFVKLVEKVFSDLVPLWVMTSAAAWNEPARNQPESPKARG